MRAGVWMTKKEHSDFSKWPTYSFMKFPYSRIKNEKLKSETHSQLNPIKSRSSDKNTILYHNLL